jgi:uncharacterized protein
MWRGRRKRDGAGTRVYYAGDIHGSEKLWRKFLGAAAFYRADVLIMGGDITGKVMTPVVEAPGGRYRARLAGRDTVVDASGVEELEQQIRFHGFYPYRCVPEEYARLDSDETYRDGVFARLMVEEVRRWIRLAEDRLSGTDARIFVMPGNDDEPAIDPALESTLVINPDNDVVEIDELQMLSCSWVNPTPWNSPREEPEDALLARLEGLAGRLDPGRPTIFNLHCPPHDSTLDSAPQLTADLEVVIDGSEPRIVPVGSTAVRTLIERHQPVLSLHGHIHESKGVARIGRTTCVNPGSAYSEGVIDGALVQLAGDEVKTCQLITG